MDKTQVAQTLKKVKENSQKRNFTQSYDLIINLKDIDLKKPEQSVNSFVTLHYSKGKKSKVCALVGPELLPNAKESCDFAISVDDFSRYEQKKEARKLARVYDFFIAQATIMPKVATAFGKVLGPRGKMPNPKAGCVVPPNANLKPLYEKLQKTIRLQTKNDPIIQTMVGNEKMSDEEVADNIMTAYDSLIPQLPSGRDNIKSIFIKLTMGKSIQVGKEDIEEAKEKKEAKKPKIKEEPKEAQEENKEEVNEKKKERPKEKKKEPKK